jgi:hypothetical protein
MDDSTTSLDASPRSLHDGLVQIVGDSQVIQLGIVRISTGKLACCQEIKR